MYTKCRIRSTHLQNALIKVYTDLNKNKIIKKYMNCVFNQRESCACDFYIKFYYI